jgi:uncharacterized membrane protein
LAAVLPTALTLAIIIWVFSLIQDYCGDYINQGAAELTTRIWVWQQGLAEPDDISKARLMVFEWWDRYLFWFGFFLAVVAIYVFGRFVASYLGRGIWRLAEGTLSNLPVVKAIFPSIKQVTDFLLTERKREYSRVVAVEYPRKGIWSLGLVTSAGMRTIQEAKGQGFLTVFIPSSPTPVTGYTITVRRDEVIDMPISIDEALRFTISGGVVQPAAEHFGPARIGPSDARVRSPKTDKEIPE